MFRYSICDPLLKKPIEKGPIERGQILSVLESFPWLEMLDKMDAANPNEIEYSPSLEFENESNKCGITISINGSRDDHDYMIFFKRPKRIRRLLGLFSEMNDDFMTEREGQTIEDVRAAVTALINDDISTLEKRWG